MDADRDTRTSATLLGRLRRDPQDQAVWHEFVDRYGPKIYHWCRRWNVQPADAEDITQDVLLKLAVKIQSFIYDPSRSFRAWLKTLTHHAWSDFYAGRHGGLERNGHATAPVETLEAGRDLVEELAEEFDLELWEEAKARLQVRLEPRTWEAFRLMDLEGESGAEVAARLHMKVASVFAVVSRVRRKLQEEVRKLERPELLSEPEA